MFAPRYFPKDGAAAVAATLMVNAWWWLTMNPSFYNQAVAISKSDTVNFAEGLSDAIYVGGAGIVVAVMQDDRTVQFTAVAGQIIPIKIKRVNSTDTTATLMVALYQK